MTKLSEKKKIALERFHEIGIKYEEKPGYYNFMIPRDISRPRYVEAGFLLAQLSDAEYPKGFDSLCDLPSKLYPEPYEEPPVEFSESYPEFLLYRVYKKK